MRSKHCWLQWIWSVLTFVLVCSMDASEILKFQSIIFRFFCTSLSCFVICDNMHMFDFPSLTLWCRLFLSSVLFFCGGLCSGPNITFHLISHDICCVILIKQVNNATLMLDTDTSHYSFVVYSWMAQICVWSGRTCLCDRTGFANKSIFFDCFYINIW